MFDPARRSGSELDLSKERILRSEQPFLLAGYPRSGTNWLSKILAQNGISLGTEPFSLHLGEENPLKGDGAELWEQDYQVPRSRLLDGILNTLNNSKSSDLGMKEVNFGIRLQWLLEQAPSIQVINLVRDPVWVASSFKENNFWERWDYDRRFSRAASLIERNVEFHPFERALSEVDSSSWYSKHAFLWILDTIMVQKTAAKFEKTLTTVGYERLSHGDNNAWNALSLALNRQIRLPSLERVSPNGHERSLKDPHSVLVPGRQIRHQEQRPSNLSAEEIEQISRVISHAPLYILSGEQKQILESSCPALYVERGSPTELEKLTLLGDNPIWISRGLIKASEFCRFLNEVQHKPYGDYIGYHHHAGNALLMWSPESKRWMVREGFADYPISNITHECANQFARFYNARLPTVDEMEELISRVAASSVGRSNIGGACDGPTPVGAFGADALGLFDIIGNLYEWVGEPGETALRVGGSFRSSLTEGMQLNLTSCWSVLASHTTGFRIVYD